MKKIKGIKMLFAICFFGMSQMIYAQESKSKNIDNPPQTIKKDPSTRSSQVQAKASTTTGSENNGTVQKRVDTQGKSFQLDENDAYQGRTEEFLSQLTVKELPSDFPKYEKWMGVRHYNEAISDYYKKHLDILIPSVKQKMEQIH